MAKSTIFAIFMIVFVLGLRYIYHSLKHLIHLFGSMKIVFKAYVLIFVRDGNERDERTRNVS